MNSQLKRFLEHLSSTVIGFLLTILILKLIGATNIHYLAAYIGSSAYNLWLACKDQNHEN